MSLKRVNGRFYFRRAQVTIFIIIGVVIVAGVAAYLLFRGNIINSSVQIPAEFQPVYNEFLSCVQSNTLTGIKVMESQGGYIYIPPFVPGSTYQPFSSDLLFLGNPIPYWNYMTGNNIPETQVPNLTLMQNQLAQFIDSKVRSCNLGNYSQGFAINTGVPNSTVIIKSNSVQVNLNMDFSLRKGNQTIDIKSHQVSVDSELGTLFNDAKKIYDYEQTTFFLENYTIDALRNYAPVDGVDMQCSPVSWSASSVFADLKTAISENIMSVHTGFNKTNYFTLPLDVPGVNFITSPQWPSTYEVNPTQGDTMIAEPIGNQPGLGILGFCYVPYHFVYSIKYPVLTTITNGNEIFQFPMAVIVEDNTPRTPSNQTTAGTSTVSLCNQGKTNVSINVFDSNSNPVDANISYECFGQTCSIGQSVRGSLNGTFPQCSNGYVVVSADGYQRQKYLFSTVQPGNLNIVLNKLYNESLNLEVNGQAYTGNALVTLNSSNGGYQTLVYPQDNKVNLTEGNYNIQVYIYENSSITISATTKQECVNVPNSGLAGALGSTQQKCFTVNIPQQVISNALAGGGDTNYYLTDGQLQGTNQLNINVPSLPTPTSLQQLQNNYILVQNKSLSVSLV